MKVFVTLVLVIGSAAALGSGPYLPSGWKPNGPAFYLPSEPQNPIDIVLQGSESASSDFLQEYGPPAQEVKTQSLPEAATEQSFDLEAKFGQEESTEVIDDAVTEVVQVAKGKSLDIEGKNDAVAVNIDVPSASENTETAEGDNAEEAGINNIADAIDKVENEVATQDVQIIQDVTELQSSLPSAGSSGLPAEFLEYGPPGFREYGPPKHNFIESAEKDNVSTIEARRRRFSPKFKVTRKQRSLRKRLHH